MANTPSCSQALAGFDADAARCPGRRLCRRRWQRVVRRVPVFMSAVLDGRAGGCGPRRRNGLPRATGWEGGAADSAAGATRVSGREGGSRSCLPPPRVVGIARPLAGWWGPKLKVTTVWGGSGFAGLGGFESARPLEAGSIRISSRLGEEAASRAAKICVFGRCLGVGGLPKAAGRQALAEMRRVPAGPARRGRMNGRAR